MANESKMTWGISTETIVVAGVAILVLYTGVVNPVLKYLGIKKDDATKGNDAAAVSASYWKPNFWRQYANQRAMILTRSSAEALCKRIVQAFGVVNDNEAAVYAVFRSLKTQTQVSYLADVFNQLYGEDLYEYLRGGQRLYHRLEEDELAYVNRIVAALPIYKI